MKKNEKYRCEWTGNDPLMIEYHDKEWGVPVNEDRKWFEYILLDAFQAGLSWKIILHKRENFRKAFDGFDFNKIVLYGQSKINSLLNDQSIVRNKLKIHAAVTNARQFLKIRDDYGSFNKYIWDFVDGKPQINHYKTWDEIPPRTPLSDKLSKDLRQKGFKFVGSTICYAFMQGGGIVNDHILTCFRHRELSGETLMHCTTKKGMNKT